MYFHEYPDINFKLEAKIWNLKKQIFSILWSPQYWVKSLSA